MYLRKSRLLTPGPTPLLPSAVRAMAGADLHHRTQDFRAVYSGVIEDLHYFMGTANGIALFSSSGSGAMEAAVSNLFSPGDKAIVCSAGKFGERWVQMARAYDLQAVVLEKPYGQSVSVGQVDASLRENPDTRGVFVQATESSTGISHDVEAMARVVARTDAILVVDAITGLGSSVLEIDAWGLDVVIGGSQKALMIPPGLAYCSVSEKSLEPVSISRQSILLLRSAQNTLLPDLTGIRRGRPASSLILGLAETLRYIREVGRDRLIQNAQMLARAAREAARAIGLELFIRDAIPAGAVHGNPGTPRARFRRDRAKLQGPVRIDHCERPGINEGPDLSFRPPWLFRFSRSLRDCRGARNHLAPAGFHAGSWGWRKGSASRLS